MNKKSDANIPPTEEQVAKYNLPSPMLNAALTEMREFSKKKQDGVINQTKIALLNRLLKDIKEVLVNEPTNEYLDLIDEDMVPQNSDAVLILGQYRAALDRFSNHHFKSKSIGLESDFGFGGHWVTKEHLENSSDE